LILYYIELIEEEERRSSHHIKHEHDENERIAVLFLPKLEDEKKCGLSEDRDST